MNTLRVITYILDGVGVAIIVISFLASDTTAPWYPIGLAFMLVSTLLALYIARLEERSIRWEIAISALLLVAMIASLFTYFSAV